MSDSIQAEIESMWRQTKDVQLRDRLRAVQMVLQGYTPVEVAPRLGRSARFVQKWVAAYREGGLPAVRESKVPGAKSKLTQEQEGEFCAHMTALLRSGAIDRVRGREVVRFLSDRFDCTYSLPGAYELMNRLGLPRRLVRLGAKAAAKGALAKSAQDRGAAAPAGEEPLLRALVEAASDGVCVTDAAGQPLAWNRRFIELWRLSEQGLGGGAEALLEGMLAKVRDPARFAARMEAVAGAPEASSFEVVRLGDGRVFEQASRACAVPGGVGRVWRISDITARTGLESELRAKETGIGRIGEVLAEWQGAFGSMGPVGSEALFDAVASSLVSSLGVARAGIWLLSDEDTRLSCHRVSDASGAHVGGVSWLASGCPHYFAALAKKCEIAAPSVADHPAMREMAKGYFAPLGVASAFDAPIHAGGRVAGVVRLEHVGAARAFSGDDRVMAHLAAGVVARHLGEEQLRRAEAEQASSLSAPPARAGANARRASNREI